MLKNQHSLSRRERQVVEVLIARSARQPVPGVFFNGSRRLVKAAAILVLASSGFSQAGPTFDAASVKPHVPGQPAAGRVGFNGGPGTSDPTLVRCNTCTLTILIREAFDLRPYQLRNFTDSGAFFDLAATVASGATRQQERGMLQSLLVDRFHLAAHRESREATVYDIVPARNGAKMIPSASAPTDVPATSVTFDKDGFVNQSPPPPDGRIEVGRSGKSRIRGINEGTADLATRLSFALNRPIVDSTALTGKYDYALVFDTSALVPSFNPAAPDLDAPAPIEALLEEQLGLRLQKRKGSIDVLIVDHVDKTPTGN